MNKRLALLPIPLLLFPALLRPQVSSPTRPAPVRVHAEAAIEFTTSSNASQVGVPFLVGYWFTVRETVELNSLGAVLNASSIKPVFGSLPVSLPVSLWDDLGNLLVSATVSTADPLTGHFNYHPVAETSLVPGVKYTIAALVPAGWSVLSDLPAMTPGSAVVYGGARSSASAMPVFPSGDTIGRNVYLGPGFTYLYGSAPVAVAGRDFAVRPGAAVHLDGSDSFSNGGGSPLWEWRLISVPPGSAATLQDADSATPSFVADREGVYVAQLTVRDNVKRSVPSTVTVFAEYPEK